MRTKTVAPLALLLTFAFPVIAQSVASRLAPVLDQLAGAHYEDQLQAAFGTFTYEYSELATPFSRWLEDELTRSVPQAKRVRLFNRAAASAMDPAFRNLYADFFASNQLDALLSGRYFSESAGVRVRLDLTSLRNGNLIGSAEILFRVDELPRAASVAPDPSAAARAKELTGIIGGAASSAADRLDALAVSLSTERGPGGAYRDGESLRVYATVNQDAYLRLYHVEVNGQTKLIWPNRFGGGDGLLKAGAAVTIPGPADPFDFKLGAPYGTEFIKAVASTEPFTPSEADFQNLGTDARSIITRGINLAARSGGKEPRRAEALASYVILGK